MVLQAQLPQVFLAVLLLGIDVIINLIVWLQSDELAEPKDPGFHGVLLGGQDPVALLVLFVSKYRWRLLVMLVEIGPPILLELPM